MKQTKVKLNIFAQNNEKIKQTWDKKRKFILSYAVLLWKSAVVWEIEIIRILSIAVRPVILTVVNRFT